MKPTPEFGPRRFLAGLTSSCESLSLLSPASFSLGVPERGVGVFAGMELSASSPSSTPKDSLPLATAFFFFFRGRGVDSLYFGCQRPIFAAFHILPSYRSVFAPETLGVLEPLRASRSFSSKASARRLRKSDRWTKPTVCSLRRSSAVEA